MQSVTPDTHVEFSKSRKQRVAILDWVLFHVEHGFYEAWTRYRRALAQRNAALRNNGDTSVWDGELVTLATTIVEYRSEALELLRPFLDVYSGIIPGVNEMSVRVRQGWSVDKTLDQALLDDAERDRKEGYTHSGAHRGDLEIFLNGRRLREEASQGQLKLVVLVLRLSQIRLFSEQTGRGCILLLDDLPAELDPLRRSEVLSLLSEIPLQVFITATEPGLIGFERWPHGHQLFHVEHGLVETGAKGVKNPV
jgi:DNA replication and repair protein RecF